MSCSSGKMAHTKMQAKREAKLVGRRVKKHLRAYRCAECGRWHIATEHKVAR